MGTTVLQTLTRKIDGLLFLESFESSNFMLDQGWTLLNGVPNISSDAAKDGIKSLIMDTTYPWIEKNVPAGTVLGTAFEWGVVYFLDDPSVTTGGFTPFVQWQDGFGAYVGLGVDLSVSTTNYTKDINGTRTATSVARSTGWKRFTLNNALPFSTSLAIDGTNVSTGLTFINGTFVRVGTPTASGSPAFGYFDVVQCTASPKMTIDGLENGQVANLYDEGNNLIVSAITGTPSNTLAILDMSAEDMPFRGYLNFTAVDGVNPFYHGDIREFSAGDQVFFNRLDMERRPASLSITPRTTRNDTKSLNGQRQSVFFNDLDFVTLNLTDITEDKKNELLRWWTYAKRGGIFNVAMDSGNIYLGRLTTSTPSSILSVDTTVGVNKGSKIVYFPANGYNKEVEEVLSVASASVMTLTKKGTVLFEQGAFVRGLYYWPWVRATDRDPKVTLKNAKLKRWDVSFVFEEAVQ